MASVQEASSLMWIEEYGEKENSSMNTIELSIVIPVWHTPEEVLRRALDSTVNIRISHETVVIFDGEPASELHDVVRSYAHNHVRSEVIDHAGLAAARNAGIRNAVGKWTTFLDADDELVADGMEKLVRFGNLHGNQIVQGAYEKVMHNGTERCHLAAQDRVYAGKDTRDYLYSTLRVDLGTGTAWGKIFLRAFLNDERVCFDETLFIEDTMFMFDAARHSRSVGFVDAICYRYDRNAQSLVTAYKPDYSKKISTYLDYFSGVIRNAHDQSMSTLFDEYVAFYLLLLMLHYVFNPMNPANETERRHQFRQLLEDPMYSKALRNIPLHAFTWSKRLSIIALRMKSYTMMRVICGLRHRQLGDC